MRFRTFLLPLFVSSSLVASAMGQDDDSVSRAEHEALKAQFEVIKAQLDTLTADQAAAANAPVDPTVSEAIRDELQHTRLELATIKELALSLEPGDSRFHVTGYGHTVFTDKEGDASTFDILFAPVFLWEINDRLFFETELAFNFGGGGHGGGGATEVDLEYAHASYLLNDYVTLGAGKFLTPFGIFGERLHPSWINKLPNAPQAFSHHGGITPMASIGAYARGGFALGSTKWNYALYLSNGPRVNDGKDEAEEAGLLHFDNYSDMNNNKAIGGRFGFLPVPEIELGYSFQFADVAMAGSDLGDVDAFLQSVDASYVNEIDEIMGVLDARFEWVWSDVDTTTYDVMDEGVPFALTFDNQRNGGYFQLAYRPTKIDHPIFKNIEIVGRYDMLDVPFGSFEGDKDMERIALGVNYWLTPSSVLKFSYQTTEIQGEEDEDAFFLMFAVGF